MAGTCCGEVRGARTLFPFLQTNLLGSVYFGGAVRGEQAAAHPDTSRSPFAAPRGDRVRVPARTVLPMVCSITVADCGGCGWGRVQREDNALFQSPLNNVVSFGGLLHLRGAPQARTEGVSPSGQMTLSDGHGAGDMALFALIGAKRRCARAGLPSTHLTCAPSAPRGPRQSGPCGAAPGAPRRAWQHMGFISAPRSAVFKHSGCCL